MYLRRVVISLIVGWVSFICPRFCHRLTLGRGHQKPCPPYRFSKPLRKQQGFLMPVAMFIIVGMGFMALTLSRTNSQTATSVTQEAITLQSLFAAETGTQYGLNLLFYRTALSLDRKTSLTGADDVCSTLESGGTGTPINSIAGLQGCTITINCTKTNDAADTTSFYAIKSAASCGSGTISATRTIEVAALLRGS